MTLTLRQDALLANAEPALDPQDMDRIRLVADYCLIKWARSDFWGMHEEASSITDPEERVVFWGMLRAHSAVRAAIKEYSEMEKRCDR